MESGPGEDGFQSISSVTAGGQDGKAEAPQQDQLTEHIEEARPVCLSSPSSPGPPSRRTVTNSEWEDVVNQFRKQNVWGEVASPGAFREARVTPPPPPAKMELTNHLGSTERAVQTWMEIITGKPFLPYGTESFARNIKTGERLCELVNAIRPGTIPNVHRSHKGFEQMENIECFLAACSKFGVPNHALVDTIDIHEMKDTAAVVACLLALGSTVQVSCPSFEGPHLGMSADPSLVAALPSPGEEDDDGFSTNWKGDTWPHTACVHPSMGEGTITIPFNTNEEPDKKKELLRELLSREEKGPKEKLVPTLNMQDIARPSSCRRGFTTMVGTVSDLQHPTALSARARKMCPEEVVNSPRALVYDTDPIGHPTRSPTASNLATSSSTSSGGGGFFNSARSIDLHSSSGQIKPTFSRSSTTGARVEGLSPAALWGAEDNGNSVENTCPVINTSPSSLLPATPSEGESSDNGSTTSPGVENESKGPAGGSK